MNSTQTNGWRWLGLGLLLAILFILWLLGLGPSFSGAPSACCGVPVATAPAPVPPPVVTTPPPAAKLAEVDLGLQFNNGKITLLGSIPTREDMEKLVTAATFIYGGGNVINKLTVVANTSLPAWWGQLTSVFNDLQSITNHGLNQSGNMVSLTGEVATQKDIDAKQAALQALLGNVQINNLLTVKPPVVETAPIVEKPIVKPTEEPVVKPAEKPIVQKTAEPAVKPAKKPIIQKKPEPTAKPLVKSEPPAIAAEPSVACSADMNVPIHFANNSATLGAKGRAQLDQVVKCLNRRTAVIGHTDNYGESDYNLQLSKARSKAVIGYIRSIDPEKAKLLTAAGRGENQPIASNAHRKGRAVNRRIEFVAK